MRCHGFLVVSLLLGTLSNDIYCGEWKFSCQRDEIAPKAWKNKDVTFRGEEALSLSGGGCVWANGSWGCVVQAEPDTFYRFTAHYTAKGVDDELRSVLGRVIWLDEKKKRIGRSEYPETLRGKTPEGWRTIPPQQRVMPVIR